MHFLDGSKAVTTAWPTFLRPCRKSLGYPQNRFDRKTSTEADGSKQKVACGQLNERSGTVCTEQSKGRSKKNGRKRMAKMIMMMQRMPPGKTGTDICGSVWWYEH
ncbi:hypothetical protein L596_004097 [Steinernema carpocapsae]|uniref:Uncharacterized protein n=1 Tax=Steinernema carpocapsae TaxID=34508 RepID=A0A4U8UYS8_STECR|nr:hypothetical protein L596_004097 [Steinernema carpocapsae]